MDTWASVLLNFSVGGWLSIGEKYNSWLHARHSLPSNQSNYFSPLFLTAGSNLCPLHFLTPRGGSLDLCSWISAFGIQASNSAWFSLGWAILFVGHHLGTRLFPTVYWMPIRCQVSCQVLGLYCWTKQFQFVLLGIYSPVEIQILDQQQGKREQPWYCST